MDGLLDWVAVAIMGVFFLLGFMFTKYGDTRLEHFLGAGIVALGAIFTAFRHPAIEYGFLFTVVPVGFAGFCVIRGLLNCNAEVLGDSISEI